MHRELRVTMSVYIAANDDTVKMIVTMVWLKFYFCYRYYRVTIDFVAKDIRIQIYYKQIHRTQFKDVCAHL